MTAVVPSYVAKVSRAKKHLIDLNWAVDRYASAYPYTVRKCVEGKKKRTVYRLTLKSDPSNTEIPIIAADAIYNLRSSLDHLMSALVASKDRGSAMFPIFFEGVWEAIIPGENQQRVKERMRWASSVKTLPNEAVAVLKTLQPPDGGGNDPGNVLLRTVNSLSNRDRHEKLPVVAAGLSQLHVQVTRTDGSSTTVAADHRPYGALQNDAELHGIPEDAVDVQIAGTALVAIQGREKSRYIEIPQGLITAAAFIEAKVFPALVPFVRP
jgi:hypothetical protein